MPRTPSLKSFFWFLFVLTISGLVLPVAFAAPMSQNVVNAHEYLITEDTANGYMSGAGDGAQEGFQMALFKRPNGTYLIGFYTYGEGGLEDTPWIVFLDYANGRWTDVSRRVIPGYDPVKLEYQLPQHGTTIRVFKKQEEGDPPHLPRGCVAQAWGVAEVLRVWQQLTLSEQRR